MCLGSSICIIATQLYSCTCDDLCCQQRPTL